MRRVLFGLATVIALSQSAGVADGQIFGHRRPPPQSSSQQIDCDMVAANPGSGMDKATCEQMKQVAATYDAAKNDPAGARPGDDQMTCDQIKAELRTQQMNGPSAEHLAEARSAGQEFQTKQAQVNAEGMALVAKETAAGAATSAASAFAPNAVGGAAAAAQTAENQAFDAHARAEMQPAERRTNAATAALVGDMAPQMAANPRLAHLMDLGNQKHCRGY